MGKTYHRNRAKSDRAITILGIVLVAALALGLIFVAVDNAGSKANDNALAAPTSAITGTADTTPTHYVQFDIAGQAPIVAELYGNEAPITVENFVKLVGEGFYDGLTFHRIISGFMMQGGDPDGNGMGGSGASIKGEFLSNGVENNLKHTRGVLSMARTNVPDSATSQFFIMHQDAPHLDGSYAAFGKVISGIETVDALCANTPVQDGNGTVAKADQPVITSVKLIDKPAQ